MEVHDARDAVGEVGELMVVGGENCLRFGAIVGGEVFGHRPREAQAVKRGGAAANLIEDHQTA